MHPFAAYLLLRGCRLVQKETLSGESVRLISPEGKWYLVPPNIYFLGSCESVWRLFHQMNPPLRTEDLPTDYLPDDAWEQLKHQPISLAEFLTH